MGLQRRYHERSFSPEKPDGTSGILAQRLVWYEMVRWWKAVAAKKGKRDPKEPGAQGGGGGGGGGEENRVSFTR